MLYPFDDYHRYHRPAAVIASSIAGDYQSRIDFLAPRPKPQGMSDADMRTLQAFGIKPTTRPK